MWSTVIDNVPHCYCTCSLLLMICLSGPDDVPQSYCTSYGLLLQGAGGTPQTNSPLKRCCLPLKLSRNKRKNNRNSLSPRLLLDSSKNSLPTYYASTEYISFCGLNIALTWGAVVSLTWEISSKFPRFSLYFPHFLKFPDVSGPFMSVLSKFYSLTLNIIKIKKNNFNSRNRSNCNDASLWDRLHRIEII